RYSWLRDAAFTTYALMRLGFLEEAAPLMEWTQKRCETATKERDVMIMYAVDGSEHLPELVLAHLDGYRGAQPARIGNGAVGPRPGPARPAVEMAQAGRLRLPLRPGVVLGPRARVLCDVPRLLAS